LWKSSGVSVAAGNPCNAASVLKAGVVEGAPGRDALALQGG
jgi:hypothetical protein